MSCRDILQRRSTDQESSIEINDINTSSSSNVKSTWVDSPLVKAAKNGGICVLDGIDRVDSDCLLSVGRLLNHGFLDLPK